MSEQDRNEEVYVLDAFKRGGQSAAIYFLIF